MTSLTSREQALEQALRDVLPMAETFIEQHYDYVCTHGLEGDLDTCTCGQEALDKMVISKARKLLSQENKSDHTRTP